MKINNKLWIGVITLMFLAIGGYCAVAINAQSTTKDAPVTMKNDFSANTHVILETSLGNIEIALYNETPQHRDNFIKLVNNGTYNGVLFHRVIKDFMIQTGDPDSKNALADTFLGAGGPGYDLPAEIVYPKYFHKRGALAAARQGDEVNPERKSSGSQFYIVTGRRFSEYQLNGMIERLANQAQSKIFNSLAQQHAGEISQLFPGLAHRVAHRCNDGLLQFVEPRQGCRTALDKPFGGSSGRLDAYRGNIVEHSDVALMANSHNNRDGELGDGRSQVVIVK